MADGEAAHESGSTAIDPERLAPVLRGLKLALPVSLSRLPGGSSPVFRVDLADGTAVVLKTYDDLRQKLPARETYASSLLVGLGIPITRYLAIDETRSRLPFRYALTNYLPGTSVAAFSADPDVSDLYRQMGAMLRRLHTVRLPAFGGFDAAGIVDPVRTNEALIAGRWAGILESCRRCGMDAVLAEALDDIVRVHMDLARHSTGAVFAHNDFQTNNVLAERGRAGQFQLTGLIDFGNAGAADPLFDLAKTLFCCEHEAPGSSQAIRQGYGPLDHPEPEAALWLYTLIHRASMWFWLRHIGVIPEGTRHELIVDLEAMAEQKRA